MTRDRDTRWVPDDRLKALGLAIAAFGPMVVAGIFVPFRTDTLIASNMGLVFVIVVVLAAAQGGRTCGIISAVMSTLTYDFFFTRPYQSLKIDRLEDVGTAVLLLVIGLLVAELMGFAHASRTRAERIHTEIDRAHRVGELVASNVPGAVVAHAVEVELTEMLALTSCRYEPVPLGAELPVLAATGGIDRGRRRWVNGELSLPAEGAEIPVRGRGRSLGRLVLVPDLNVGISVEERRVAVILADELGAALAADERPSDHPV